MKAEQFIITDYYVASPWEGVADFRTFILTGKPVVVKEKESFVGVLSVQDIASRPHRLVADVLTNKPCIDADTNIEDVIKIMIKSNAEYLPIFNKGEFKGVVRNINLILELLKSTHGSAEFENRVIELEKLLAINEKFLLILGHDLKNLFNQVLGSLELLQKRYTELDYEKIHSILQLSKQSTEDIIYFFDSILNWSKLGFRQFPFNPRRVSLNNCVQKVISQFSLAAINKGVSLRNHINSEFEVIADLNMLTCIFLNLIYNAIKFTPSGGKVFINAEMRSDEVLVMISDNGIGIPYTEQRDLFIAVHSTLGTNQEKGTGMGLIICKEFVEKHGGKIWIESEIGMGTQVNFTIPYHQVYDIDGPSPIC